MPQFEVKPIPLTAEQQALLDIQEVILKYNQNPLYGADDHAIASILAILADLPEPN